MTRPNASEMLWIKDFGEADEILKSKNFYTTMTLGPSAPITGNTLISLHGADHLYRRRTEILMFSRPALVEYELELVRPTLRDGLRERVSATGTARVPIQEVMRYALVRVAARIVGLDDIDTGASAELLISMAERIGEGNSSDWATGDVTEVMRRALVARDEFRVRFFQPALERRRVLLARLAAAEIGEADLPNDLLTLLLRAYDEWDEDQLQRECMFFLGASASTTTSLAPHALIEILNWITEHPEDAAKVHDTDFIRLAVHEALRLHPPVPGLLRAALEDVELASGRVIRKGEFLALDLNSVNRRPDVFGVDADTFNPYRAPRKGVHGYGESFGAGAHVCPGRLIAVGATAAATAKNSDDNTVGVLVRLFEELFRYEVALDPDDPPMLRTDTQTNRYASFSVLVSERGAA